jgi:hypothetical protein
MDQSTNQQAENVPAPVPTKVNGLAVASIIIGVIAILTGLFVLGGLIGLIGLVLGLMSLKETGGKKPGLIGVALNAVAILLALIAVIFGVRLFDIVRDSSKDASEFKTVREFSKGEDGKFGNLTVTVDSVTRNYVPVATNQKAEDGKELVVVKAKLKNSGTNAATVEPEDFKLESDDGLVYGPGFADAPTGTLQRGEVKPGAEVSGELVYKIKKDAKSLKFIQKGYDYNSATKRNEYVTFKLGV